jgi:carbon starvation protein
LFGLVPVVLYLVAYGTYGRWIEKHVGADPERKTPAQTVNDGRDYVPTHKLILFGHHFASICGGTGVIGPITAAVYGWLPAALWILFGNLFIGAAYDYMSLMASVRFGGKSVGVLIKHYLGRVGYKLFLLFVLVTMVLIVAVFALNIGGTFAANPSVASTSMMFMVIAVAFGWAVYRARVPLGTATVLGLVGIALALWLGFLAPVKIAASSWVWILLAYCFLASVAPVWVLLQPRDYLNAYLLIAVTFLGVVGLLVSAPNLAYPAFTQAVAPNLGPLFPMVLITISCGAVSGSHAIIASGTTSKQLANEKDAKMIAFGGMLLEGVVAFLAIATVAKLSGAEYATRLKNLGGPVGVFGLGVGEFMSRFGIPVQLGASFSTLCLSAFMLTSMDTIARLGRYCIEELLGEEIAAFKTRTVATLAGLFLSAVLIVSGTSTAIWPVFGTANQLLTALVLIGLALWLSHMGKNPMPAVVPMVFMFVVEFCALGILMKNNLFSAKPNYVLGTTSVLLTLLAVYLASIGARALSAKKDMTQSL